MLQNLNYQRHAETRNSNRVLELSTSSIQEAIKEGREKVKFIQAHAWPPAKILNSLSKALLFTFLHIYIDQYRI